MESAVSSTLCRQVTTLTGSFSSMMSPAEHSCGQGGGVTMVQVVGMVGGMVGGMVDTNGHFVLTLPV